MSANASSGEAIADREVVITRTYDVPARLLFEAWSKPEHLMKWFGPVGWPLTFDNAFEAPGSEKMIMTITFDEKRGKTLLSYHTLFASAAMKREYVGMGFAEGAGSGLDQLADVVAAMKTV